MKISLVIPAYNEAQRLGPFLREVAAYVQRHRGDFREVIVVNDGSKDNTVAVAEKYRQSLPILRILNVTKNRGKGAAIRAGVLAARGDVVVFMDADGATPIGEMPKMIRALEQGDIGVGNRWMKGARTERHSPLRRLSGWIYRTYMRLFGLGRVDTMCGFKGYRQATARELFQDLLEERWLFDTEIAYKARRRGLTVINFPIRWESKDGSKLSTKTLIASAWRVTPLIRAVKRQERART
jgi:dolichyl-phosphate beta-glucosyltransferase